MAKKFSYSGPELIRECVDCLYSESAADGELYCEHPENKNSPYMTLLETHEIPKWCPLPDDIT